MNQRIGFFIVAAIVLLSNIVACADDSDSMGPLRIHPDNPRYFSDGNGHTIWLTGSHTWANLCERGIEGETPDFDYAGYLDFLEGHGHNFIRLWAWEQAQWMQFVPKEVPVRYSPLPYQRTGPGTALDGKPKFDLTKFNEEYFTRLRTRVEQARERGIYVGVMLFQGFSLDKRGGKTQMGNAWQGHPFNKANNVNGIDGNPSGDDSGHEVHELKVAEITKLQEAYVRKVIDTLGDMDNVLWEIGNECHGGSVQWQYHMIRFIKQYESEKGLKPHLVGMTGAPISAEALFASPADWISPPKGIWLNDPPVNEGKKIVIVDTDHCDPWHHDPEWVWKALFRGHHFILMDGYMDYRLGSPEKSDPLWDETREAMGDALWFSDEIDLAGLEPDTKTASSGYCLKGADRIVVYAPKGETVDVDLKMFAGAIDAIWFDIESGEMRSDTTVANGLRHKFTSPYPGRSILFVTAKEYEE